MSEQMQQASSGPEILGKSFKWIARFAFPDGSIVRCPPCGKQRACTTSEIAVWMETGFPKCKACGHSVDLINPHIPERIRDGK